MQRRIAAAVAGGVLLLALGGFVVVHALTGRGTPALVAAASKPSTCADAYRLLKLRPSEVTAANPVCLKESLKLSGELVGSIAEAYSVSADSVAPASMCAKPRRWDAFPQGLLAFVVNGKGYRLRIAPPGASEHQPVTLTNPAGFVELASISDPSIDWNQATGFVDLNSDGITGLINIDLRRDVAGARPVHITGQWACGAPLPLPTFDATAPCADFYALNRLQDADVTRMKAVGCNGESLTFTEDVSGVVGHAVTDSIARHPGFQGDNYCGSVNGQYTATFKFSIGDESFLLDLGAESYGGIGPGQYDAASSGSSIGVVLSLGIADPAHQGQFVPDEKILWMGQSGSFTIAPDVKSGTVDAELRALISGSSVHVKGSWRCAA